jgi:hypothetical protein
LASPWWSRGRARLTWRFTITGEWYVRSKALGTQDSSGERSQTADSVPTPLARYTIR